MSEAKFHRITEGVNKITGLIGKVVKTCYTDVDSNGYPFLRIEFEDGLALHIIESGQTGWIEYIIEARR